MKQAHQLTGDFLLHRTEEGGYIKHTKYSIQ